MKRFVFVFIINVILNLNGRGQNLVPNGGFEQYSRCPFGTSVIYYATPWFQPNTWQGNTTNSSSSDLFDTCGSFTDAGIPLNVYGFQPARTGHGYAGIFLYFDTLDYSEYIEVPLISPLIANKGYCIQFYVSLADSSKEAISNIGTYFSVDSLLDNRYYCPAITYVTPQFENPLSNILNDKTNWMLVSGNFIANGGERYMTLGNFHLPANTNAQTLSNGSTHSFAYYYIDDISVTQCNVGIEELTTSPEILISPNPATSSITITSSTNIKEIKLINLLGEEVIITNYKLTLRQAQGDRITNAVSVDVSDIAKGIYFVEVTVDSAGSPTYKNVINKKIVIQ